VDGRERCVGGGEEEKKRGKSEKKRGKSEKKSEQVSPLYSPRILFLSSLFGISLLCVNVVFTLLCGKAWSKVLSVGVCSTGLEPERIITTGKATTVRNERASCTEKG
jgi:hypothetical protein